MSVEFDSWIWSHKGGLDIVGADGRLKRTIEVPDAEIVDNKPRLTQADLNQLRPILPMALPSDFQTRGTEAVAGTGDEQVLKEGQSTTDALFDKCEELAKKGFSTHEVAEALVATTPLGQNHRMGRYRERFYKGKVGRVANELQIYFPKAPDEE